MPDLITINFHNSFKSRVKLGLIDTIGLWVQKRMKKHENKIQLS